MTPHLIAYLDLDDLLAELVRRDTQAERVHVIHVQPTTTTRSTGHSTMLRTSAITITTLTGETLHVARIELEQIEIWQLPGRDETTLIAAMAARADQARDLVVRHIGHQFLSRPVACGIALLPGVSFEAIRDIHTTQSLFRIKQTEPNDPSTRILIVRSNDDAALN